jgi:hypothetical protein
MVYFNDMGPKEDTLFDDTFFKFLFGFTLILSLGFATIFAVDYIKDNPKSIDKLKMQSATAVEGVVE